MQRAASMNHIFSRCLLVTIIIPVLCRNTANRLHSIFIYDKKNGINAHTYRWWYLFLFFMKSNFAVYTLCMLQIQYISQSVFWMLCILHLLRLSDARISRVSVGAHSFMVAAVLCDGNDNRTKAIARHQFFQFITYFYQHICQSDFFS